MSAEDRLIVTPTRPPAHSYFVGRRESDAAEIYELTATGGERLRPGRRHRQRGLDWRGSEEARMELSHLLISRVSNQRPSRDLQARFSLHVLGRLPVSGFVLESDDLARWLRVAGFD